MNVSGTDYFNMSVEVEIDPNPHDCPVCGITTFAEGGSYDICKVCGREDDPVQLKAKDLAGGANTLSLNQARSFWVKKGTSLP